jgi:hypothetical protein
MAKAKAEPADVLRSSDETRTSGDVRIDGPHVQLVEPDPSESHTPRPEPAFIQAAGQTDPSAPALQLRTQAAQLADHLSTRQRELDRREAELNARAAKLEEDMRSARLWLIQRRAELDDREAETTKWRREAEVDLQLCHVSWERDYQERVAAVEKKEAALNGPSEGRPGASEKAPQNGLDAAEKAAHEQAAREVKDRAEEVRKREQELNALAEDLRVQAQDLESRSRQLQQAQANLAVLRGEVETLHQQLIEDRRKWQEHVEAERQLLAADRRRETEELEQKRLAIRRRAEQADRSRAALQQMREDLRRMHRETLEIRLASEELWVQLSETTPAAVANRLLEQLRAKLAEQYRLAGADLVEQSEELTAIRTELAELHQKLVYDRQDFQQWAARRQAEIERKTAELAGRKERLERQEADLQNRLLRWQTERLDCAGDAAHRGPSLPEPSPTAVAG